LVQIRRSGFKEGGEQWGGQITELSPGRMNQGRKEGRVVD
jgi:hypothetical protein